ncbi:hypothetical protein HMPREF0290_0775, partial [Corynebacterium efficiens YS-314]
MPVLQLQADVRVDPCLVDTLTLAQNGPENARNTMPKNTYTDEFKADAVRLYETTEGASFSMIATDLGISRATLKNWVY